MNTEISVKDRLILRDAAKKQLEFANTEKNKNRIKAWYQHNSLKGEKPLITIEMATFAHEILPERLLCEASYPRDIEAKIRSHYLNQELFDDDFVTPDYFPLQYDSSFTLFAIEVKKHHAEQNGGQSVGHHFIPALSDLEADYEKIKPSVFHADMKITAQKKDILEDLIGDIIPVKINMGCLYSVPTQMLVHIMSMEDMMYNMMDYPELFKEMMNRIAADTLTYYDHLEQQRLILPTVAHDDLGNGSLCYTNELPGWTEAAERPFSTHDVWGFMDSQETVAISPQMFAEFIFPCYQKIAARFGLLSYGCCEPVDPIWENCLSKLNNLRKLSISPWANEEKMGEYLQEKDIIYFRKPSPNYLGVDKNLDEAAVRAQIKKSLQVARGLPIEIAQRDVYTIHHHVGKVKRYVDIIREEIENRL